ncbi:MAG TPA: chaperone modulator CbpM [Azospirillum sp.]
MVIGLREVLTTCRRVSPDELTLWIERHWVRPHRVDHDWSFSDIDVARLELICDLRDDLALDDEAVPVVLGLLDTVYGLRRRLHRIADAVATLPPEARDALADALRRQGEE